MAIDFPNSPTTNQIFTVGSRSWIWDGIIWAIYSNNPVLYRQDSPPSSPQEGDQWFETDTGRMFVYYGTAWVELGNATDIAGAIQPSQVTALSAVTSLTSDDVFPVVDNPSSAIATNKITANNLASQLTQFAPQTSFRNAIINGDFRINQRAFTSTTTSGAYGFDRWVIGYNSGTLTYSSQTFTVGSPAATGYESPTFARVVSASQTGAGHFAIINQKIEDVRTLANSTVTISFWAKAGSGTPKVGIETEQYFGLGGSPSANVTTAFGAVTLSTSWARYSVTATIPNINGKTIGTTANTSFVAINLWVSAGSSFDLRASSIGTQNNTFDFWGVQVERGSVATPCEQRPIQQELALCQRYYYLGNPGFSSIFMSMNTNQFGEVLTFAYPVTMRATPTMTNSFVNVDNTVNSASYATNNYFSIKVYPFNTGFGYGGFTFTFIASAEF
jgi:hypothetical protein